MLENQQSLSRPRSTNAMRTEAHLTVFHSMSATKTLTEERFAELRHAMVETQIRKRGIRDERVLQAMRNVPRHEFVTAEWKNEA